MSNMPPMFIVVPKNASASIQEVIPMLRSGWYRPQSPKALMRRTPHFCRRYKYAVIRNPISRLVSTWNWVCIAAHNPGRKRPTSLEVLFSKYESLSHFVNSDLQEVLDAFHCRPMLRRQSHYLDLDGQWIVDYPIRFEHLQEDWVGLAQKFGFPTELKHRNASKSSQCEQLSAEDIEALKQIYARDFELWEMANDFHK